MQPMVYPVALLFWAGSVLAQDPAHDPGSRAPAAGGPGTVPAAPQPSDVIDRAYPLLAARWPFPTVFVCWESSARPFPQQRQLVQRAVADSWDAESGLVFAGWGECQPDSRGIRVAVKDAGPQVSYLGVFLDGEPEGMVLNFTYARWGQGCRTRADWCNRVIAVHEFGHAIGFAHEQNRPDTPGECGIGRQGDDGDTLAMTPWDPHSVMNYCNETYGNDGRLSEFDIAALRQIYGEPE